MSFTPEQRAKAAETNRRRAEERRQRQELAGIPDSAPFAAPPGTFPEPSVLDCHVGGVLVRDLPVEAQGRILYRQTDEGIAAANAGKSSVRVQVTSDQFSKDLEHRRDDVLERGMEPWEATNMLKRVADQYARPGDSMKFLSARRVDSEGGDTRGFEIVKDAHGDPVRVQNMVLGRMPKERAARRNKFYRDKANSAVALIEQKYNAKHDRMMSGRSGPETVEEAIEPDGTEAISLRRGGQVFSDQPL